MKYECNCKTDLTTIEKIISSNQIAKIVWSMNNKSYSLHLNYGFEIIGESLILYCHCNKDAKKLDTLRENPNISVEIDNKNCKNTKEYFLISSGKVEFINNIYDKIKGLNKIIEHSNSDNSNDFKNKVINNITLIKITCTDLKAKSYT